MKSPRLPYFYYLPLAVISFFLTLSVAFTVWFGIGSWNLNRTINWGFGWFPHMDSITMMYVNTVLTSLPTIAVVVYFLRQFLKRRELHLIGAVMLALLGFVASMLFSALVR